VTADTSEEIAEGVGEAVTELRGVRRDSSDRGNVIEAGLPRGVRVPSPRAAV
jgi:hypothetical protein